MPLIEMPGDRPRIARRRQQATQAHEQMPNNPAAKRCCRCLWKCCTCMQTGPRAPIRLVLMCETRSAAKFLSVLESEVGEQYAIKRPPYTEGDGSVDVILRALLASPHGVRVVKKETTRRHAIQPCWCSHLDGQAHPHGSGCGSGAPKRLSVLQLLELLKKEVRFEAGHFTFNPHTTKDIQHKVLQC